MTAATSGLAKLAAFVLLLAPAIAAADLTQLDWSATLTPEAEEVVPEGQSLPQTLQFGESVAFHGSIALAGMPAFANARGRVAVFTRESSGEWYRTATLEASDAAEGDAFGQGVALYGRTAMVSSARAVYVFRLRASWEQIQRLPADGDEWFNYAMDFQRPWLLVGAGGQDAPGAAYLFRLGRSGVFERQHKFIAPTGSPDELFGASVAVWNGTVAIGAPGYNAAQGTAYVFRRTAHQWTREQLLNPAGDPGDGYGAALDLRGATLVVGAPGEDSVGPAPGDFVAGGAAHVFGLQGRRWVQLQRLRPTPQEYPFYLNFGANVQLHGKRLAVAVPYNWTRFDPGLVFLYSRSGRTYTASSLLTGEPSLGTGLSLSASTLMAGVPWDPAFSIGYVLVHELGAPAP